MNARQKAKKYKRELDILKGRAQIPFLVEKTLNNTVVIASRAYVHKKDAIPEEVIYAELIRKLIDTPEFKQAITFQTAPGDINYAPNCIEYLAELKVVMPDA